MSYPSLVCPDDPEFLGRLPARLRKLGFYEESLRELLGLRDLCQIKAEDMPVYLTRCQNEGSITSLLAALFLLRQPVSRPTFVRYVGEQETRALMRCGALLDTGEALVAEVDLFPCLGRLVFTDHQLEVPQQQGHVYELGADSYAIARVTPRRRLGRALDLCTGSGIHAILAAAHSEEVVAVDINPRALEYSRLNALMNGVSVRFLEGDLWEPVEGQFELITANPPFVPSPDAGVLIHRSPGETGEEVSERLLAGLPRYLAPGGLFSMVLDYPVMRDSTYLERLSSWLGETRGWGIVLLNFGTVPREHYIQQHLGPDGSLFEEYLASYERLGIEAVGFANVFVLRLEKDVPNFTALKEVVVPAEFLANRVEEWLHGLARFHDPTFEPDWDGWKPKLSRHFTTLWRDWDKRRGMLETADFNWCGPVGLDKDQALFVSRLRGRKSAGQLLEAWARTRKCSVDEARGDFMEQLRFLAGQAALE